MQSAPHRPQPLTFFTLLMLFARWYFITFMRLASRWLAARRQLTHYTINSCFRNILLGYSLIYI
jgi:hypothetical protein